MRDELEMKEILKRYQTVSDALKASVWFAVSNILVRGISFLTLPVFSRILTTEEYGLISVYQSWTGIFTIFCTLTIWGGVFNVAIVKNPEKIYEVVSSFQGLAATLTLAFLFVTVLFLGPFSRLLGLSEFLTVCMYIEILALIPFALWSAVQRYFYKYKLLVACSVTTAVLNPAASYYVLMHTEYRAEAKILVPLFINAVLGVWLFAANQKKGKAYYSRRYWTYGFRFNAVLIPHYLSMQILNQSDRLMINSICGSSDAGIYSAAYTFAMLLGLLTSAVHSSFTPWLYRKIKEQKYEVISKVTNLAVVFVALVTFLLICIIPDVFRWMLPEEYEEALRVIPPAAVASFFMFLYPLFGAVEFYYEENKYITAASAVSAVANIILNALFLKRFGFCAAAYTTLVCYVIYTLAHYYFMKKILRKNGVQSSIYDTKFLSGLSAAALIFMMLLTVLYHDTLLRRGFFILMLLTAGLFGRRKFAEALQLLSGGSD